MFDRLAALSVVIVMLAATMQVARSEEGIASIYGSESGSRRADGKRFRPREIGCAHKTRKLGSVVRVTVVATGRSIACPINDRGPFAKRRVLDLSTGAARALGVHGLASVRIE